MLRKIGGALAGLVVGVMIVAVTEAISSKVYPLPAGVDARDPKALAALMKTLPLGALLFVLTGWFLGTLAGSWLAAKMSQSGISGSIVVALLFIAAILNMVMIPHPTWFMATSFVVFFIAALAGARLGAASRAVALA